MHEEKKKALQEDSPRELTKEDIEGIKHPPMPEDDAEQEVADIEKTLREYYVDLKKIFEFYAAGGEGGAPTDIAMAEWHKFCDDCKFANKTEHVKCGVGTVSTQDSGLDAVLVKNEHSIYRENSPDRSRFLKLRQRVVETNAHLEISSGNHFHDINTK